MSELDTGSRVALVAAAAMQAGPGASDETLEQQMARLLRFASGRAMARVERILEETTFPAVILSVDLEATSQRGMVKLRTEPSKRYPDGIEPIRTDPMWGGGRSIYERARSLVGHKVLVHKAMESKSDGTDEKVRILIGLTDLGRPDSNEPAPGQRPQEARSDSWGAEYDPAPPARAASPAPAPPAARTPVPDPDTIRASLAGVEPRSIADDNGLPRVNVPKGQMPGVAPTEQQLAAIAQLLAKLGYDDTGGRIEVYRLLKIPVTGEPTLKAIPTWYEASQLMRHLSDELNALLKARRSA